MSSPTGTGGFAIKVFSKTAEIPFADENPQPVAIPVTYPANRGHDSLKYRTRWQSRPFELLGFEFRWSLSRKFRPIIKRRTSRKKLKAAIANFSDWIKSNRNKKISSLMKTLRSKYRGYWNYYGVIGNHSSLKVFYYQTTRILFKWLNRRSQRAISGSVL